MKVEVVVVGNAGIDTEVFLDSQVIDLSLDSQFTRNVDVVGQAGGYSARGFARLGRTTRFFGALGDDAAGGAVRRALASDGVQLDAVFRAPQGTARSVNLMTPDGQRRAFYDGRVGAALTPPEDLAQAALRDVALAHVHLAHWAPAALPGSAAAVAVDLQDAASIDDEYRADFIAAADIVFLSGAQLADPVVQATELTRRGEVRTAVVGLGRGGALAVERGGRVIRQPPPSLDVPIVDSNGAGDSLAVGFLDAYVLDGLGLDEALHRGQVCARWACGRIGSDGLITRAQLVELA